MPQFHSDAANDAGEGLDAFTRAYILALYFTDTGETSEGQPDSEAEMSAEALAQCVDDCAAFQREHAALLARAYACDAYAFKQWTPQEQAGHDFWLTRNGHGCGFWDRGLPDDIGAALTDAAHAAGNVDAYAGDDEKIYIG